MPYFDPTYLFFVIPGLAISLIAQFLLKKYYATYSQVRAENNLTGIEAGNTIIQQENLKISSEIIEGELTDNYDSQNNIVHYSSGNTNSSIAGIAVVAHELGHACQDRDGFAFMKLRTLIVPITNIGTNIGLLLVVIGIAINFTGLSVIGLFLYSFEFLFTLVTLPVEFDASSRAMKMIQKYNLLAPDEVAGAKKVLTAAALTYVAATASAFGQFLYYAMRVSGRRRD